MPLNSQDQADRIKWSIKEWNRLNFVTATLPQEETNPRVISSAWLLFSKDLRRHYGRGLKIVRVLQKHTKGHGWHVHALFNQYVPSGIMLHYARLAGLGRLDFRMVSGKDREKVSGYLARYISRDMRKRDKTAKGLRMISAAGSINCAKRWWVRCSDFTIEQDFTRLVKSLRICIEEMGCVLANFGNPLSLFTLAPPAALAKWRELNPGFAF